MGYFTSPYASELLHRAVTVYMYLKDQADKDGKCYPAIWYHRRGAEAVPQHRQARHCRPYKKRPHSEGAAVARKRGQKQLRVLYSIIGCAVGMAKNFTAVPGEESALLVNSGGGHDEPSRRTSHYRNFSTTEKEQLLSLHLGVNRLFQTAASPTKLYYC